MNCSLIVFGGTGDLAHRKLYPAVYNLLVTGQLPENFILISVGRRDKDDKIFREEAAESIKKYTRDNRGSSEQIQDTVSRFFYFRTDFSENDALEGLGSYLEELENRFKTGGNRMFYLAVAPEHFGGIVSSISRSGIDKGEGWRRLVIEKPFGSDLESARELNDIITDVFKEDQVFRIDHFLGKEMLQNIMVIRFANALFEPLWNSRYIDHIQITSSETVGVENRGGYYENSGALRDMMQNHMLQLLMLLAMEPPRSLDTQDIRDEKVKLLKSLSAMSKESIRRNVVRGQYGPSDKSNGRSASSRSEKIKAYRDEERVSPYSFTETYIAMKLEIENFRWAGVPFYLRTGKRMPVKGTKIVVQFKDLPGILYYKEYQGLDPNRLIIEIQPREGVVLRLNGKKPGTRNEIIPIEMDFCQNCAVGEVSPDAYERLLYDVMRGDSTLFTRWDEVQYSWMFVDEVSNAWTNELPDFPNYSAGSWGPAAADALLTSDGRRWYND